MVKQTGTHKVSIDRLTVFESSSVPEAQWVGSASSTYEDTPMGLELVCELNEQAGDVITAPFVVSGNAVRGTHYELRTGPGLGATLWRTDEIVFEAGNTDVSLWVTPIADGLSADVSVVLTLDDPLLADPIVETYTLGLRDEHTVSIANSDPAADPRAFLDTDRSSVDEGGSFDETAVLVGVSLSRPADGNEILGFSVTGTATLGVDYVITTPSPLSWNLNQQVQDITITVLGNVAFNADKTIIITLDDFGTDLAAGTLLEHTITVLDDDALTIVPSIAWEVTTKSVAEGAGSVSFYVDLADSIADEHEDISIDVVVRSAPANTTAAQPGEDYSSEDFGVGAVNILDGSRRATVDITFPVNDRSTEDHVLVVDILSTVNVTATRLTITIVDNNSQQDGVDGPLLEWDGVTRLAPERVQFDASTPDIEMYTDTVFLRTGPDAGSQVSVNNDQSMMDLVTAAAEVIWLDKNVVNGSLVQATVLMGSENALVLIKCYDHTFATPGTQIKLGDSAGDKQFKFNVGNSSSWSGVQDDCITFPLTNPVAKPCIRDVVFYGADPDEPTLFAGVSWGHSHGLVDNFRLENLRLSPRSFVKAPFFVSREIVGGTPQGRIKLYDCSGRGENQVGGGLGWGSGSNPRASKWGLRAEGRAAWDIRNRPGLTYKFADSNEEHYIYIDSPVGPVTYPAMDTVAQLQGMPLKPDGHYAGNYFIGVTGEAAAPPGRTAFQIASRRTSNPGDIGSGDLTFVRCVGLAVGSEIVSGGQGFTIWGHGGRVYIKDCEYLQGGGNQSLGGMGFLSEQSWANSDPNPHGQEVIESGGTGYLYQIANVVVDGFTYNVSSQGSGSRSAMKFFGVQTIKLIKFDLISGGSWDQINMNSFGYPGLGFTETFDIDDLVYPDSHAQAGDDYVGAFSAYPGWNGNAKINDGYFMNWYGDTDSSGDGAIPMDTDAIDNYPAIVADQKVQRLDPQVADLSSTGFWPAGEEQHPDNQDFPTARFPSGNTSYIADTAGEAVSIRIDTKHAFMCILKVWYAQTGTYSGTFDYGSGSASPVTFTPPQAVGEGPWNAVNEGDSKPLSYIDMGLTINTPANTGTSTETIILTMDGTAGGLGTGDAGYDFPKGSGTFVDVPTLSTQRVHTINVVPNGAMGEVSFNSSSSSAGIDTAPIAVTVNRTDENSNPDGLLFDAVITPTRTVSGLVSDVDFTDASGNTVTSYTIPAGQLSTTIYLSNFVTSSPPFTGQVSITLVATTNCQLGAISNHLMTVA